MMMDLRYPVAPGLLVALALCACVPANPLMPMRGEDTASLAITVDRHEWLTKSAATRAFDALRAALEKKDFATAYDRLGPATRAVVEARATEAGTDGPRVLRAGQVQGLGVPGADDPILALSQPGKVTVAEDGAFDPGRRQVRLIVRVEGMAEAVELPALFTDEGWRIELVRLMEAPPAPRRDATPPAPTPKG